jgi:hypothetical protein
MAGLDPAIHAELHVSMDHRVKPGGDEKEARFRPAADFRSVRLASAQIESIFLIGMERPSA